MRYINKLDNFYQRCNVDFIQREDKFISASQYLFKCGYKRFDQQLFKLGSERRNTQCDRGWLAILPLCGF